MILYEFLDLDNMKEFMMQKRSEAAQHIWNLLGFFFFGSASRHIFSKPLIFMNIIMTPWEQKKEKKKAVTVPM